MTLLRSRIGRLFLSLIFIYLLLVVCITGFQRKLLYLPQSETYSPAEYGLEGWQAHQLPTTDGEQIMVWSVPARDDRPYLIFFHGNGGHLGVRAGYFHALADAGYGIIAMAYRGYSGSTGSPTEQDNYADATMLVKHAQEQWGVTADRRVLYGESLGTGVATYIASQFPARAVILQSPFTSVADRAQELYPFMPVRWLLLDHYDSISRVAAIHSPLLIMHGTQDQVVPVQHGKRLYEAAQQPKQLMEMEGFGHNDLPFDRLLQAITAFLDSNQPAE